LPAGPDTPQVPVPGPATILPDSPTGPLPIEEQPISLPSNGNVPAIYCELELSHHISHADHHLNRIRDLIAEKSFHYSHVISLGNPVDLSHTDNNNSNVINKSFFLLISNLKNKIPKCK